MTEQNLTDPNHLSVLDHGFIRVVDHMGDDSAIVQAARVSYGKGTKSVNEDRTLVRYLMRHQHWTPFEMCVVKFHVKAPIFVIRQWIRHRTASVNEQSARYSEMTDDFYVPDFDHIEAQAKDNKQGRAGVISNLSKNGVRWMIKAAYDHAKESYKNLLGDRVGKDPENPGFDLLYDPYDEESPLFDENFPGIAREIARVVMPLGSYSEFYWQMNLRNLFHFLQLRADPHAQYEIRVFADAIIDLIKPLFPVATDAANDYLFNSKHMSRMDMLFIKEAISNPNGVNGVIEKYDDEKKTAQHFGMTVRELKELIGNLN